MATQPVALLMGARQVGKSTLVRRTPALADHRYLTLDSLATREQAHRDPEGLIATGDRFVIDEVQRAPDLLLAIKASVDADRRPGRFVLTGSANLLGMKKVTETLAGRASYVTLWPMTRREHLGLGTAGCWSDLAAATVAEWPAILEAQTAPQEDWREAVSRSAYPPVALFNLSAEQQADWLQGYLDAFAVRDVAEWSQLSRPLDLVRLMRAMTAQLGQVEHQTTWNRLTGIPRSTVSRWADLLEVMYQLVRLPAFSVNRTKRLTRSPKVYWSDTAMALHLAARPTLTGHHLENLILADLVAWCWAQSTRPTVHHWRTADQAEVDVVLELPSQRVLPIEVKAGRRPDWSEVTGLRTFLTEYPDLSIGGLVLHGGTDTYRLAANIVAAPWWRVV